MTHLKPIKILLWILATLLLVIVAVAVFIATFDWNRARPYINRKVSESTGREFAIRGELNVKFKQGGNAEQAGWRRFVPQLAVAANDVQMSNPGWSKVGPHMAAAQRISVALRPLPLLSKHVVLTDLALNSPVIALERRADGSNSWTMKDNGPSAWEVDIGRLTFDEGKLRYLDSGIDLDLRAKAKSIAGVTAPAAGKQPFGIEFELGGTYNKAPVTGSGKAGGVLSLQDDHISYPVQAHAQIGKNKIGINGTLTDPRSLSGLALDLTLGGASMADLYPLTGVLLPETPAYATHGLLVGKKTGEVWSWAYQKFTGTVGGSDVAGTLEYLPRQPRALLRGAVSSQQLRLEDLGPLIGANSKGATEQSRQPAPPAGKALPVAQFNTARWKALDADVKFTGKRLVRTHDIPLENIVTEIRMKDQVLSLAPLNFGMAGGTVTSNISLDGRKAAIDAQIKMGARHVKIRELFPKLQSMQASFGEINGDAALTGHGNSISTMLASANGELGAVVSDGSVSKFILEAAGLNIANAVFVKVFGDKQIHLNCLASDWGVKNGLAEVRRFVIDTDDAVIDVTGNVNLAQETLNLDVRPQTKGARVFSLRSPLYAKGTFSKPDIGPYKGPLALKAGAAVALAAVAPVAALLPLVNVGNVPDTDCAAALAKATETRRAPKSEATAAPAAPVTEKQVKKAQQEKGK
ncbi:MAG: AsmA family protein [Pseudomonadota bacterium]